MNEFSFEDSPVTLHKRPKTKSNLILIVGCNIAVVAAIAFALSLNRGMPVTLRLAKIESRKVDDENQTLTGTLTAQAEGNRYRSIASPRNLLATKDCVTEKQSSNRRDD